MKNILFDLDGTLTDPFEGITNSVKYALNHYGIDVADTRVLAPFIGPPLIESFGKYYGFSVEKATEAVDVYREYFTNGGIFENKIYAGIIEMLKDLKERGCNLYIATSKPEVFAVKIAEHFGFYDLFCSIRGIPLDGEGMSKGEVISKVMSEFSLDKAETVMVGDRSYDVKGAHLNGIKCVGVLYGYGSQEEFEKANCDYTVKSVKELHKFLV